MLETQSIHIVYYSIYTERTKYKLQKKNCYNETYIQSFTFIRTVFATAVLLLKFMLPHFLFYPKE